MNHATSTVTQVNHAVESADEMGQKLAHRGIAFFKADSRSDFIAKSRWLGPVLPHRDADPDGVTVVRNDPTIAERPGYQGLSSGSLDPHTDGSGNDVVPRYVALWCATDTSRGGESVFVDGQSVLSELERDSPWAADLLGSPDAVMFRSGTELYQGPVFNRSDTGELHIRLRLDTHGFFSARTHAAVATLKESISRQAWTYSLSVGEGYVIDNWRILHGRRSFEGHREMLRVLIANSH